jgi:hypothetical protein
MCASRQQCLSPERLLWQKIRSCMVLSQPLWQETCCDSCMKLLSLHPHHMSSAHLRRTSGLCNATRGFANESKVETEHTLHSHCHTRKLRNFITMPRSRMHCSEARDVIRRLQHLVSKAASPCTLRSSCTSPLYKILRSKSSYSLKALTLSYNERFIFTMR